MLPDLLNQNKMKIFHSRKDISQRGKRQWTEWEKVFAMYTFGKRLQNSEFKINKSNTKQQKKMGHRLREVLQKEDAQISNNNNIKSC